MQYEFGRQRVRLVNMLGEGQFGEVWLAQAFGISQLKPRDESRQAVKERQKLRKMSKKKINKEFDKKLKTGSVELAAVKRLKGTCRT